MELDQPAVVRVNVLIACCCCCADGTFEPINITTLDNMLEGEQPAA